MIRLIKEHWFNIICVLVACGGLLFLAFYAMPIWIGKIPF